MIDRNLSVRTAIYQKLAGQLALDGKEVPVYSKVAPTSGAVRTYVYVPTQFNTDTSVKTGFSEDQTVRVEAVHRPDSYTDATGIDLLAAQIKGLLAVEFAVELGDVPGLIDWRFKEDRDLQDVDGVEVIYRRILTFEAKFDAC